jgi:hypothetical protein
MFKKSVLKSWVWGGLNGTLLTEDHLKRWGASPPTFFDWLPGRRGPFGPPKTDDFRTEFLKI